MRLRNLWESARLPFKMQRFEVLFVITALLVGASAAVFVRAQLDGVGVSQECLERWMATAGEPGPCGAMVRAWAMINESQAGKVMASMSVLPFVGGLFIGVPLVGRELEDGTAAISWALAQSRTRWLLMRAWPFVLLLVLVLTVMATAAALLEDTRTAGGVWASPFADASFFGPPVVARGLAGLAVGIVVGAVIGRTLPSIITGALIALTLATIAVAAHDQFATSTLSPGTSLGGGASISDFLEANPHMDVRLASPDGRLLSFDSVLATVPPRTSDPLSWIDERFEIVPLGVSAQKTREWQQIDTAAFLGLAAALLVIAVVVVNRRRPI